METNNCSRRDFLRSTTALGVGVMALGAARPASTRADTKLRVLSIGVIGTIGGTDRQNVHDHPLAEIVGLCDIDANALDTAAQDHPGAFTCADYREAFDRHGDGFDAAAVVTGSGSGGFGLFNIRERLQLLGATLEIDSGSGTSVTVTAPLNAESGKEAP